MAANLPDPGNIPDMSLGERNDKPSQSVPARPEFSYQLQPISEVPPSKAGPDAPGQPPAEWQEGDRVLAPWEPMFLYAGTIKQIRIDDASGDKALIEFDDGDAGWVYMFSLCTLQVRRGQRILCRRRMGPTFGAAEVLEVRGEEAHVQFDEGGKEWTTVAAFRIPCVENGPGAVGTKFSAHRPAEMSAPAGNAVPSWLIWVGISILFAVVRIGCRSM